MKDGPSPKCTMIFLQVFLKMEFCGGKSDAVVLARASRMTDLISIQTDVCEDVEGTLGSDLHTFAVAFLSNEPQ